MDILGALRKMTESIKEWSEEKLTGKVDKVSGKQLTEQNYSLAEKTKLANSVTGMRLIDGKLYFVNDDGVMEETATTLPSGGGGGTVSEYTVTLTNLLESRTLTVTEGSPVVLKFNYSSVGDNGADDGDGVGRITINDVVQPFISVPQGDYTLDITSMMLSSSNSVVVRVENTEGVARTLTYTISIVSTTITSKFDTSSPYTGDIIFPYVANGYHIDKNVYFEVDGTIIDTVVVSTHNSETTYTIPAQIHGTHVLRVWFDCVINNTDVTSNVLYFEFMSVADGNVTPIIVSNFQTVDINQYDTIVIPYNVYDPVYLTTSIILSVDDIEVADLTVDRTQQLWSYRANEAGTHTLKISCGTVLKTFKINVAESLIDIEASTDRLSLYLSSYGRSNNEADPAIWEYNDIKAQFTGFNFVSDGWQLDEEGVTVLRVSGDARLEIPSYIFASDFRTTGKTIEIEFASRDVLNYETVIISCMSDGKGVQITPQMAELFSEQSSIGTQYKEEEHMRLSFVIEKRSDNRFILIYVNGILSSAILYPESDGFAQMNPVALSIGSNECTTDIYCIRVYDTNLNRYQILDNWIADTQNGSLMIERYSRNQIYNEYGEITVDNLPVDLPYLVIEAEVLPQSKGDKKTCSGYYVDVLNPSKSFEFINAQIDVQGTSSQYYYVKNYKIKFKNGFKIGNNNESDYQLNDNAVPTSTFTFKADVASSEGANNVVLAQLYNELCPAKTPPQLEDSRVRQTIDGHPIVIFWKNNGTLTFLGKYNFNNDKGTEEVFGFKNGDESWEIRQNGTERVGWRSDDFESVDASGNPEWLNDFEARYPEDNMNITNLKALATWLKSTDTTAATNEELPSAVMYNGVTYAIDSSEYRLAKFRAELPQHADVDDIIFYYLFTEIFLCIDQREKNAFPTLFADSGLWMMLFYDADSTLGIDNKGKLAFSPYLEDIDYNIDGSPIYNGQASVLFVNLRKAFYPEIQTMYQQLRTDLRNDGTGDRLISYDIVNRLFENHQSKWCEAIFNEDMFRKCLEPYILDGDDDYIDMLLGKKEMHRKWWLYNRFRYLDSKYVTGNSMNTRLMIRAKGKSNLKLISYVDMYGHVYYNSEMVEHRMERGKEYEFVWSASGAEDAVVGVNDADMITSLGDLAPLQVETINISNATHLTSLKIGDGSPGYQNSALTSVGFGNNVLLRSLDLRNCVSLATALDASGCTNIEEVLCEGSSITGISLPDGGVLRTLHLPGTVSNLTVLNQNNITDFSLGGYDNLTTIRIEGCSGIPVSDIVNGASKLSRVRLLNVSWEAASEEELRQTIEKFKISLGQDESGADISKAVVTGRVTVPSISDELYNDIYENFPDLIVDDGSDEIYILSYKDRDGKILYLARVAEGSSAIDPIEEGLIERPATLETDTYKYTFIGWSTLPTNISRHYVIAAQYSTEFAIKYYNGDELLYRQWAIQGDAAEDPIVSGAITTPIKEGTDDLHYVFFKWDNLPLNVQSATNVYALFSNVYPVRYYATEDSLNPHYVQWIVEGSDAYNPVTTGECDVPTDIITDKEVKYAFSSWSDIPINVSGICIVYAQYDTYWAARFWNEDNLYLLEWVLEGNNVIEPKDYFEDYMPPTKTSTAQYDFTFSKWEGNFEVIAEPRDFIAVYYNTIRKYNVYFYNDTELLQTVESVSYGDKASYTGAIPTKLGVSNPEEYVFKGWLPAPENITGETYCYALFKFTGYLFGKLEDVDNPDWVMINSYWTTINNDIGLLQSGALSQDEFSAKYQIGGRMLIPITLIDGSNITVDVSIIAYNHDDLADGTGKASLTFFCEDLPNLARRMNEESSNAGGWEATEMRTFLNEELFVALPDELQGIIKPVYKISDGGSTNKTLVTTIDNCWLASYEEVGLTSGSNNLQGQGELYLATFSGDRDSRKKYITDDTSTGGWWLRSSYYSLNNSSMFWRVTNSGGSYSDIAFNSFYVAFGFCI